MQVARTFAKIGRDLAFDHFAVNDVTLPVHFQNAPHMAGNGNLFTRWRRCDDGAQFLGITTHRILFVFLKDTVEFKGARNPFSRKAYDEASLFCALQVVRIEQMSQTL